MERKRLPKGPVRIVLNGRQSKELPDLQEFKKVLCRAFSAKYIVMGSLETGKATVRGIFDLLMVYCEQSRYDAKGPQAAKYTREINRCGKQWLYVNSLQDKTKLLKWFYDFLLGAEGLRAIK